MGNKCEYLSPAFVPSKRYELRNIEPVLYDPKGILLSNQGILPSDQLEFKFTTNAMSPISFPNVPQRDRPIHSINIVTYSSVEGNLENNTELHEGRAATIKEYLGKHLKFEDDKIATRTEENWDMMSFQFGYFYRDDLLYLPKDSVKARLIERDDSLPWDSLFFEQRKATATLNYFSELPDSANSMEMIELNLRMAVAEENYLLANKALYDLYYEEYPDLALFYDAEILNAIKMNPDLVQNAAAVLSKYHKFDLFITADLIHSWMIIKDKLGPAALRNLLHLYSLTGVELLNSWDVPSARLSNVINPIKVLDLMDASLPEELVLNLHLTFIRYFGQVNDGPNISRSFDRIARYFEAHTLSLEDEINLCLFYNKWSMYHMTITQLLPSFKSGLLNEEATFLLAQTMSFYHTKFNAEQILELHAKAAELSAMRWCSWMDRDFQYLRDYKIKRIYCEKCIY